MSYNDDEELKIGELADDDLDLDADLIDPLDPDFVTPDDDEETLEGFAGIDGAEY